MDNLILERVKLPTETLGSYYWRGEMLCKCLELPWKENKRGISCIPNGIYPVTKEPPIPPNDPGGRKERPYWHFRIHNVPGRSGILIHTANYFRQLKGCQAPGITFVDLDKDGSLDVAESTKALKKMIEVLPDKFDIEIKDKAPVMSA